MCWVWGGCKEREEADTTMRLGRGERMSVRVGCWVHVKEWEEAGLSRVFAGKDTAVGWPQGMGQAACRHYQTQPSHHTLVLHLHDRV